MQDHVKRLNRNLLLGWTLIVGILLVSYMLEVAKGVLSSAYVVALLFVAWIPVFLCWIYYQKKPESTILRYWMVLGYFLMYAFIMSTAQSSLVFIYILPLLSFLILYHQPSLIVSTGLITLGINLLQIGYRYHTGEVTLSNAKNVEIQLAVLVLCFLGCFVATRVYNEITIQSQAHAKSLDEKTKQIQRMTFQTIETIANTIDAKDEYTKGHSRRVSDYSAEIAKELGMSEEEVENIRYIALLHDIGKIGVPDAVLNKPGRLSDAEYELMKTHTVIGGDILKDIGMLPDLDVGAKFHHERYDGKGYPNGLSGEEIPLTARIICMADSYDAMTSNRVYRKHLSSEIVMEEIRRCRGTQFDPEITDAFLRYLSRQQETSFAPIISIEDMDAGNKLLKKIMEDQSKQLIENAEKDQLTKVYNRSAGERYITIAFQNTTGFLFFLNLDNMRRINRHSGFRKGDHYLIRVVEILQGLTDSIIISRFGGDEFLCYIPEMTDPERITDLMNRLLGDIRTCVLDEPTDFGLTASIGISIHERINQEFQQVLNEAEKALYYMKQSGKNGCYFYRQVADREEDFTKLDLSNFITAIREKDNFSDTMVLGQEDFQRIYNFITDVVKEQKRTVELIMFTGKAPEGTALTVEHRDIAMQMLEKAIIHVIRDENAICYYSSVQRIVIFVDENEADLKQIASEILKRFYQTYDEKDVEMEYQIANVAQE